MRRRHIVLTVSGALLLLAVSILLASAAEPSELPRATDAPPRPEAQVAVAPTDWRLFLPLVTKGQTAAAMPAATRRVNAPYFSEVVLFSRTAVFWLGRVNSLENYTDVRVGYNDQELVIYTATFDRRLWYDPAITAAEMTDSDAVTLYLDLDGNAGGAPDDNAYRMQRQLNSFESDAGYQAAYRGDGKGWVRDGLAVTTDTGWRGNAPNDDVDDRGWTSEIHIPFSGLDLTGPPAEGTIWGLAVTVHDRDEPGGAPNATQGWPEGLETERPATWGQLRFGIPAYTPPAAIRGGAVTVRHGLDGATVTDAMVGGSSDCAEGMTDFFNQWGDANYAGPEYTSIHNQRDVADWPCYARTYLTFPLGAVPPGKVILSATLTLHQFGNGGAGWEPPPVRSLIWVHTIREAWDEGTITWNNAPLSGENVSSAWVDVLDGFPGWPGVPRAWDVSRAVAEAHAAGTPLRIALYTGDAAYHSGKYFSTSDIGDWNAVARPTLEIVWGNP